MELRSSTSDDLDALIAFYGDVSDAMIGTPFDCLWRRGIHPDDQMIADAVQADEVTLADDDGTIAAAVIVNHNFDDSTSPDMPWIVACGEDEAAVIHVFAAAPAYRRSGIARQLLEYVIDEARRAGLRSLRLGAAADNTPAVKLYESCGFIPVLESRQMFGDTEVDAVALELPL